MKIFASGSCRLLTTISNGHDKVTPIHSLFYNFSGINFFGKLHNSKQHIQLIKFLKDEIIIPDDILPKFLTSYNNRIKIWKCDDLSTVPIKKDTIKKTWDDCEWYMFEISSLKMYKNKGFEVQIELSTELRSDYECIIQTEEELLEDLHTIRSLIPSHKKILFQVHFRPNIIYNSNLIIKNREIIHNTVNMFCQNNKNTFIYDPSVLLEKNHSLFDGENHFTHRGYVENFNYIYDNYLTV